MNYKDKLYDRIWFPFTCSQDVVDYPHIVIKRGKGIYLYDDKGKEYIDAVSSWWVNILGHCNPEITEAVQKQASNLEHVMMAGFISTPTIKLTSLLASILPSEMKRIFYSDNGSTAVEVGLKIALQYWAGRGIDKTAFVALDGAYHGDTLGAMSVGAITQYHDLFHKRFKKQLFANAPYCYRCPVNKEKETCFAECMDSLETILQEHRKSIAACIFEPIVQGAVGMRVYPAKVLKKIFKLCREYNVLTIADEVAMGFGRTGRMFACQHVDEKPDIMCLAKGLTGGYLPMAATVVKEHIYQEFCGDFLLGNTFHHGHSFTGNPLGSAAACATLEILIREKIPYSIDSKMTYFRKKLESFRSIPCVGDVRSIGMVGAIEIVENLKDKTPFPIEQRIPFRIARNAIDNGLLIRPLGNVLYFIPPYIITNEEIDTMFFLAKRSIESIVKT